MTGLFAHLKNLVSSLSDGTPPDGAALLLLLLLAGVAVAAAFFAGLQKGRLEAGKLIRRSRADAVRRSRAVLGGQLAEQVAPFLPGFPCNPADARFIGKPVDFIAFPGASEGRPVGEILFIEVKSGSSALSAREKEIRDAVRNGAVRYVEYRVQRGPPSSSSERSADLSPER